MSTLVLSKDITQSARGYIRIMQNDLRRRSQYYLNKNYCVMCLCEPLRTVTKVLNGTEGRTRTDTVSPPPDFESGASTNSATPATEGDYIKLEQKYK